MRIDIITLFPNMFSGFTHESIIKRAIENGYVEVNIVNLRDYTLDKHLKVDDTPYGGGAGMVLMCQPIFDAVESLKKERAMEMLEQTFSDIYMKFKVHFYQEVFKQIHSRETTLSTV